MKRPPIPPPSASQNTSSLLTQWKPSTAIPANEKVSILDKVDNFIDSDSTKDQNGVSWKHRRRLIYGSYALGVIMVLFGLAQFLFDSQAGVQAIVGGVSLISIIVSAYTGFSAWEDTRLYGQNQYMDYGDEHEGNF